MNRIVNGKKVLLDAEQALQRLLADAATSGDYDAIRILGNLASELAKLGEMCSGTGDKIRPPTSKRVKSTKASRRKKGNSSGYPRFVRDEDELVKIGWSKKEGSEYEHKAQKDVVRTIVASISRAGRQGSRFSMDAILPLKKLDGTPIPDYQSYLILAWLRSAQLVQQHGRLGYTIRQGIDLADEAEDCWNRLASRSNRIPV